MQLIPDAAVGPGVQILIGHTLHVESRKLGRATARQGKAALVIGICHLWKRLGLRQDAEPAEWKLAILDRERIRRDGRATDAVEAVAAGDDVAGPASVLPSCLK